MNYIRLEIFTVVGSSWNVMAHCEARGGEVKGKLANGVGSQYFSYYLGTWCIQHYSPLEMWSHMVTHGKGSEGEAGEWSSQYSSHYLGTWCIQHYSPLEMWWHTVMHGEGKWRVNWRIEWDASTLHTTSEHGVSGITVHLKCDGTRWRTGGEVKEKLANGVASTLHTTSENGVSSITFKLKCDGTRWRTGGEVKGKLANGVASTLHTTSEHGVFSITVHLKCDGTRWRTGREVKGKLANGVASTLHTTSKHGVSSITTADAHTSAASSRLNWRPPPPADLNGLVRFAERRNLVSARVPSHFNWPLILILVYAL